MSNLSLTLLILLVLGIVVGNIMLLKYSAKFKFSKKSSDDDASKSDEGTKK